MKTQDYFEKTNYWKSWKRVPLEGGVGTRFLVKMLREYSGKKIKLLDVACGHGRVLKILSREIKNIDLHGIDINDNALKLAKKVSPKAHLSKGTVYNLPYPDQYFDVVVVVASFMHFEKPEEALREMVRVCKRLLYFNVSTKNNVSNLLRKTGIMAKSNVPEYKYNLNEVKKLLPKKEFKWRIEGKLFLSHKLLPKSLFRIYENTIESLVPNEILSSYGHALLITGERKKR